MYLLRRFPYQILCINRDAVELSQPRVPATKEGEGEKERDRQTDRLSGIREEERDRSAVCHQRGSGRGRERQIGYLPIGEARSVVYPQRGRKRERERERRSSYPPMREADRLSAIRERRRGKMSSRGRSVISELIC